MIFVPSPDLWVNGHSFIQPAGQKGRHIRAPQQTRAVDDHKIAFPFLGKHQAQFRIQEESHESRQNVDAGHGQQNNQGKDDRTSPVSDDRINDNAERYPDG
jgi:hypothetical protein